MALWRGSRSPITSPGTPGGNVATPLRATAQDDGLRASLDQACHSLNRQYAPLALALISLQGPPAQYPAATAVLRRLTARDRQLTAHQIAADRLALVLTNTTPAEAITITDSLRRVITRDAGLATRAGIAWLKLPLAQHPQDPADQGAALHNAPLHNAPLQDAPLHDAPPHNAPLQDTPLQDTPLQDASGPYGDGPAAQLVAGVLRALAEAEQNPWSGAEPATRADQLRPAVVLTVPEETDRTPRRTAMGGVTELPAQGRASRPARTWSAAR